jgi:acetylornithine/N-succinyldiaminopimelate aminotransferase
VREMGDYLTARLQALSADTGHGTVRGRGLPLALALKGVDAAKVADTALERGLLINAPRPDSLRFMPALTVTRAEVDRMVELLEGCLA